MEEGFRSTGEAAEEKVETQAIKSSSSSLVAGIEMDRVLEHSVRGKEKLGGGGGGGGVRGVSKQRLGGVDTRGEDAGTLWGSKRRAQGYGSKLSLRSKKGNCSSWVVEMEKLLEDTSPSVEMARWNQRYIYRVPECKKKVTNRDAYQPQFVSLGPLHHGKPHLLPMEEHKRRAVLHVVKMAGKPLTEFVVAIEKVADEHEAAYDDLDDKWRGVNRGSFVQMMFTDGCFLFELMRIQLSLFEDGGVDHTGYAAKDPVFSRSSFLNLWPIMKNDMIAMENQIPLLVLQRIAFWSDTPPVSYLCPS
ncbi:hypothetical protein PVAP13_8KG234702 [Panicum virgatum]|uniref:Uncharacterized protein n=1 Tax=Panicum virgatum TaxID=38727 RepID=A0A8T0PJV2_PANVG|nr:hypothetical protein PVAP13_8KG234702 [Panicum virgatum]